jgi:hypothetical protein
MKHDLEMNECRLCTSKQKTRSMQAYGVISPWICEMLGIRKRKTSLIYCVECTGAYFSYRYSDSEMTKLYSNYREESYVSIRSKWEPWYSFSYNDSHLNSEYSAKRKIILQNFLNDSGINELQSIVDIGGNIGEFIPEVKGLQRRYVLDLSSKDLPNGISRIEDLSDVGKVDLIIYAHVLEHVSSPFDELKRLIGSCKYLYVEVPNGVPNSNVIRRNQVLQQLFVILSYSRKAWRFFSQPSAGRKEAAAILRQSEHLSFFCENTLKVIAEKQEMEVRTRVAKIITPDMQEASVIQALFKQK